MSVTTRRQFLNTAGVAGLARATQPP
ncbi:MAG: twin-arginine translocation signal domain-containing protein [Propionivibrio sp.]|uniref:Twin-arginine translocation signal domain-containing protein n=1 Tax=Candidatus Propionivibrio dominans TaxID=2954373 RepID=A0A9D7F4H2_9RHOO|nr:twin-arginine translocation signal domain-containing protein [Candidatus Propionivibrio dominans]MBL0168164.1 twin-arginine translocation signal domain-containing protein [Propionivibrio sp.]